MEQNVESIPHAQRIRDSPMEISRLWVTAYEVIGCTTAKVGGKYIATAIRYNNF